MHTFICRILRLDPDSRDSIITTTSGLGIAVNLLIASAKVIVGIIASSIAIISEGVNNASDALTSVLTLIGAKLAKKHPDSKHPFGHGRVEYLTSLVIAAFILFTGIELIIGSVGKIIEPTDPSISYLSLIFIAVTAVIKLFLGLYTIKMGKKAGSEALVGVGLDCRNDCFASIITILAAVVFLVFRVSLDAYAGILTSLLILKAGIDILTETVSLIIGKPGDKELAEQIYREIRSTEGIVNAADLMLHNYGPDAYSGSVNVEIDHEKTVGEVYAILHALQLRIMHEHKVTIVFGIYAVDNDHEDSRQIRKELASFVREHKHITSYHAVYIDPNTDDIYCDLVVDYDLRDWGALEKEFKEYMATLHPDKSIMLTIETDFV